MEYRKLGRSDLEVSVVCQGCWSIVTNDWTETWARNELSDSIAAIHTSLDAGVNFFDSAEGYGHGESEEILAKALEGRRKEAIIATKVGSDALASQDVKAHCEQSLRRLGTDYIDLYQIHWPSRQIPLAQTLGAMQQLRQEGKIRLIGVSNFGVSFTEEALAALPSGGSDQGRIESNQLCYSLLWRPIEHAVRPLCVENDISILCYSPLCQGLLTGKFASADDVPEGRARSRLFSRDRSRARHQDRGCEAEVFEALAELRRIADAAGQPMGRLALAWLLAQPGVASVITGSRNADQAAENARAGDLKLHQEVLDAMSAATEKVRQYAGDNCDLWQTESRTER